MRVVPRHVRSLTAAALAALAAGCASTSPEIPTYPPPGSVAKAPKLPSRPTAVPGPVRQASATEPAPQPAAIGLDELLALARTHHPDLAVAAERVG